MVISRNSAIWLDKQFARFPWASWAIAGACVIYFSFSLALKGNKGALQVKNFPKNNAAAFIDVSKIGTGPLRLKGSEASPLLIALTKQLVMLGKSHPSKGKGSSVLLGIQGSSEQCKLGLRENLFLSLDPLSQHFQFSSSPKQLTLQAKIIDGESSTFEIEPCDLFPQATLRTFTLRKQGASSVLQDFPPLLAWQGAKFWGPDLLIEQYGGQEFGKLKGQSKLEFFDGIQSYFLYVREGECLSWGKGRWQQTSSGEGSLAFAKIKSLSPHQIEVELWEEEKFSSSAVKLLREKGGALGGNPLTELHRRSNSEISALIGKKRMILKEGDWVLKGKHGWRKIQTLKGIDGCLSHDLRGQLFILDRLENDQLIGTLFDEMRTTHLPVRIPLKRGTSS